MNAPYDNSSGGGAVLGCIVALALILFVAAGGVVAYLTLRAPPVAVPAAPMPAVVPALPLPASQAPAAVSTVPVVPAVDPTVPVVPAVPVDPAAPVDPLADADTEVRGTLDREVIRTVVRSHLREVTACYETGLGVDPALSGRVTVSFIIAATGRVQTVSVADSTISSPTSADEVVEQCIVRGVRTWTFPPPDGGGVVGVNYPFVFEPAP